jgi:site-specific recombinase XerD
MQAPDEPLHSTAPAGGPSRPGGIRAKLWQAVQAGLDGSVTPLPDRALLPLIAEYTATFGAGWRPATKSKHRDDFDRFTEWLEADGRPLTTASLDFSTLVAYVEHLRTRPKVSGIWRGGPGALERSLRGEPVQILSANSVNAYVRPLRSLAIWLVDEGLLPINPFRRSRRRAALNPLLPSEETPTKSATLADLRALEAGCAGDRPIDLRDRAIVAVLITTAARNSSVRLLRRDDIDLARAVIRFRHAKGGKTLEIALHGDARLAIVRYLEFGRPALLAGSARTRAIETSTDPGWLFLAWGDRSGHPLSTNAMSLMLTRRYHAGGGTVRSFGSHRIRHATATLLVNNGMPLEEVSRYLGHSSTMPTRRYAQQTTESLGSRAAAALTRAGLGGG